MGLGYHSKDGKLVKNNASTDYDLSDKSINPLVIVESFTVVKNLIKFYANAL